ncbi:hypothetical protein M7784_13655 [Desulfovibrio aminophilus]|nr:hypothetical protein [Desulfovibrio aminophilus]
MSQVSWACRGGPGLPGHGPGAGPFP